MDGDLQQNWTCNQYSDRHKKDQFLDSIEKEIDHVHALIV